MSFVQPKVFSSEVANCVENYDCNGTNEVIIVRTIKIFDQWSAVLKPHIKKYKAPTAICGYMVMAVGYHLVTNKLTENDSGFLCATRDEIEAIIVELSNENIILPLVIQLFKALNFERSTYIKNHKTEFNSSKEKEDYLKDWVANYEIGDFMRAINNPHLQFIRHIERDTVKHEELIRVKEEDEHFKELLFFVQVPTGADNNNFGCGLVHKANTWSKLTIDNKKYSETTTSCAFLKPSEWIQITNNTKLKGKVFILDLLGHFVIGLPVLVKDGNNTSKELLILNSSSGSYLEKKAIRVLPGMLFCKKDEQNDSRFMFS